MPTSTAHLARVDRSARRAWRAVLVAAVIVACAGCGGSNKATSTGATAGTTTGATTTEASTHLSHVTTTWDGLPVGAATWQVPLAGFSEGAQDGSGLAVITVDPVHFELCWRFSELRNVTAPTVARLFRNAQGASGRNGLPLGASYTTSGCVHETPEVLAVIEAHPKKMWVSIHTARFPYGAVRGPLEPGGLPGPTVG